MKKHNLLTLSIAAGLLLAGCSSNDQLSTQSTEIPSVQESTQQSEEENQSVVSFDTSIGSFSVELVKAHNFNPPDVETDPTLTKDGYRLVALDFIINNENYGNPDENIDGLNSTVVELMLEAYDEDGVKCKKAHQNQWDDGIYSYRQMHLQPGTTQRTFLAYFVPNGMNTLKVVVNDEQEFTFNIEPE